MRKIGRTVALPCETEWLQRLTMGVINPRVDVGSSPTRSSKEFQMVKKNKDVINTIKEAREIIKNADVKTTSKCTIHRGKGLIIHDIEQREN